MNLEGIQTIRIVQTVLDVLLNFRLKNVDIGCNFSRDPPQYLQKSLQKLSCHDSQVWTDLF